MDPNDVKILIVDDVNTIREQLKELLASFGFRRVRAVASAQEARLALATEAYHLILCDWHMSPLTGMDLLEHARATPDLARTSFILVTAETTREKVMQAIQAGADPAQRYAAFGEQMIAIRGTADQLGLGKISRIAGLGEEISVKAAAVLQQLGGARPTASADEIEALLHRQDH